MPPPAVVDPRRWGMGDIFWGLGIVLLASTLLTLPVAVSGVATNGVWVTLLGALGTWIGFAGWPVYCSWVKGLGTLESPQPGMAPTSSSTKTATQTPNARIATYPRV